MLLFSQSSKYPDGGGNEPPRRGEEQVHVEDGILLNHARLTLVDKIILCRLSNFPGQHKVKTKYF